MGRLISHVFCVWSSQAGYSGLFRAGVALMGVALLSLSQVGPFLYEQDIVAHKAQYELESQLNATIDEVNCSELSELTAKCKSVKHRLDTLESTLRLLDTIFRQSFWFGVGCIAMAGFGLAAGPFVRGSDEGSAASDRT